jgi:uncharacterized protein YndB with AHSA1/START domain
MTAGTLTSVRRSITVKAPPERAFEVFTAGFASWWPIESHHIGEEMAVDVVIEPHVGGRWLERDAKGRECVWGFVTDWDPPRRLVLGWHLTHEYEFDPDPEHASEIVVTFTEQDGGTLVELAHGGFERYAERGARVRQNVSRDGGWSELMELYAKAV